MLQAVLLWPREWRVGHPSRLLAKGGDPLLAFAVVPCSAALQSSITRVDNH